jgi:hypothetical protein
MDLAILGFSGFESGRGQENATGGLNYPTLVHRTCCRRGRFPSKSQYATDDIAPTPPAAWWSIPVEDHRQNRTGWGRLKNGFAKHPMVRPFRGNSD